ncbi:hypothetical protein [Nocardiopsis potens]|uniref:hypothetical protein n=1 Tax=Nocardiopsis potens TaxID=1246458 RepID=UPI00037DFF3D|nr:hypothetical protein [Nocardiopsis potens]
MNRIDAADVLELRIADAGEPGGDFGLALRRRGDGGADQPPDARIPITEVRRSGRRITAGLSGLPIADGAWEVLWTDREGRSGAVATTDPGLHLADRFAYLERPRRRVLRLLRDERGRLLLRSSSASPYAEVARVRLDGDRVLLSGVLAYTPDPQDASALLIARQRGLDGELSAPAELDGRGFRCAVPLAPLAAAHRPERPHNEWDLWLRVPGTGAELRLGSRADDVVGKKRKTVFPETGLDGGPGRVLVRPYYTVHDDLSLLAVEAGGDR